MELLGQIVLYIIMGCCGAGAIATVVKEDSGLAQSFHDGIRAMASLFLPVVGLMVSVPYLVIGVENIFGDIFRSIGADPAIAAAVIIPPDCGGYALFLALARSPEVVVIAVMVAITTASTIAFNIPIGLSILKKEDHSYLALGAMSGFLSIPFAVLITCTILIITKTAIRTTFTTTGAAEYILQLDFLTVFFESFAHCHLLCPFSPGTEVFPKSHGQRVYYFRKRFYCQF